MIFNWDKEYKVLYIGKSNAPPNYGVQVCKYMVKFLTLDNNKLVGAEIYL